MLLTTIYINSITSQHDCIKQHPSDHKLDYNSVPLQRLLQIKAEKAFKKYVFRNNTKLKEVDKLLEGNCLISK